MAEGTTGPAANPDPTTASGPATAHTVQNCSKKICSAQEAMVMNTGPVTALDQAMLDPTTVQHVNKDPTTVQNM